MPRRKKSRTAKILRGTFRSDRDDDHVEPEIDPIEDQTALERPTWLDDDAVTAWNYYLPILIEMGVITKADLAIFTAFTVAVSGLKAAEKEIESNGLIVIGASGPKKNPACTIRDECMRMIRSLGADLGLTPASRPGLHANPPGGMSAEEKAHEEVARRLIKP